MKTAFPTLVGRFQKLSSTKRTLLTMLGLCAGLLLFSWALRRPENLPKSPGPRTNSAGFMTQTQIDADLKAQWERIRENSRTKPMSAAVGGKSADSLEDPAGYATPEIAHAAELAVATKEFAHSRTSLEEILDRHHGYVSKLRMVGQPTSSMLTATLRVPSSEFGATVSDLKRLGNVECEEQTADEITEQRADLEARLTNAQNSLARLQGILAKGGKVTDLAKVQRELANVSSEIARLEADRMTAEHRVTFAQVLFSLREEIPTPKESIAAGFQNAALTGFSDALSSLTAIAIFTIGRGPVILLWVVLIYFPARWAWRKWHPATGTGEVMAQG